MKKKSKINPINEDVKWMARDDAHILSKAEEIKMDPARLKNAAKEALSMVQEKKKEISSLSKISRKA